ncbi:hypothetical protein FHS11_003463 [Mucilaginibacter gotjawali]|uniref:Uncharacterized protein n=1 Tax=Mucilaginibacter gotjawali TaxID=1550579 RepID=A0A839SFF2_9SPHI|nr:hypothetical protein [Mucilaginibacter gotjawali]
MIFFVNSTWLLINRKNIFCFYCKFYHRIKKYFYELIYAVLFLLFINSCSPWTVVDSPQRFCHGLSTIDYELNNNPEHRFCQPGFIG